MSNMLITHHQDDPKAFRGWPDPDQDRFSKSYLGFWIYLLTDCILFAALFVTYAVLQNNTYGGPSGKDLFNLPTAFLGTSLLLLSSAGCGLALLSAGNRRPQETLRRLAATLLLGAAFLFVELVEFSHFVSEGHTWKESAFLSSFFALVGTHGLHIATGLIWGLVMVGQLIVGGITPSFYRRLTLFTLFWHFLDLIWIFIFTFVYLQGVL